MDFPKELKYTKDHEWVKVDGESATMGITEFAQEEIGEVVFVDLPGIGSEFSKGDSLCVVESTKAASDVYAPIGGRVVAVNEALSDEPGQVNEAPYENGWLVKLEGIRVEELQDLMDADAYAGMVQR